MNDLITTNKSEVKAYVKCLSEPARKAVDTVFAYIPDIAAAESKVDEARRSYEPMLCDSFSKIASDKDGIEKAGFKNFGKFAEAVFGMKDGQASQYKRVGDKFFNVEKRPIVAEWYTVSKLHELRSVDNDRLDKDAADGVLTPDMTQSALRAYAASVTPEKLTDGNDSVSSGYVAVILPGGKSTTYADESAIYAAVNGGEKPIADRLHVCQSDMTIIVKARDDKHKDKEIKTRLCIVEHDDGTITAARFWKNPLSLSKEDKAKAADIRAALERHGIDTSGMTAQDLLNF